jgi:dephospho-CoA kinase
VPFVVGLTGGIGSGKSAAAEEFARLGAAVVDADAIAHELTAAGGRAIAGIRQAFGEDAIGPDGAMDRVRMRARVFADARERERLEALLHPMIRAESERRTASAAAPYVIQVVPLLLESREPRQRVARVLVVDCPEALQIERVRRRSGLDEAQVRRILAAQMPRDARRAAADDVIDNSGSIDALHKRVAELHEGYLRMACARE